MRVSLEIPNNVKKIKAKSGLMHSPQCTENWSQNPYVIHTFFWMKSGPQFVCINVHPR